MSVEHRRDEVAELLPQLRGMAQTLIETVAAAEICLGKLIRFGGVDSTDFNPSYDTADAEDIAIADARRDETAFAISAASDLLAALDQPCKLKDSITIKEALLTIAKR